MTDIDEILEGMDLGEREYTIVYWVPPPYPLHPNYERRMEYDAKVAALKTRPNTWGMVEEGLLKKSHAKAVRKALEKRGCRVVTRTVDERTNVYAVWDQP